MAWADLADKVVAAGCKAFGVGVVNYQPAATAAFDLASGGVFTAEHEIVAETEGGQVASTAPMLGVRASDFPTGQPPRQDDKLTLVDPAENYRVREVQPDGVAGYSLILWES